MIEAFDLLEWRGSPTEEEVRNESKWGVKAPPTVLGYGIEIEGRALRVEMMTVSRKLIIADRRVTLYRRNPDGELETADVLVRWDDALNPARWGGVELQIID